MKIRLITENDTKYLPKINNLLQQLFNGEFPRTLTEYDLQEITRQHNVWFYGAFIDELVGQCLFYHVRTICRNLLVVEELTVDIEYRRQGIGTQLLKKGISLGKYLNVNCIELEARQDNNPASNLYLKHGFYDREHMSLRLWVNK